MIDLQDQKKLVKILQQLMELDKTGELVDEVLNAVNLVSPQESITKQSVLYKINEHCIEKISNEHAQSFYSKFPIDELKQQLIVDFVQMEHQRRRGDFKNFCLCVYQQIECVVGYFNFPNQEQWDRVSTMKISSGDQNVSLIDVIQPLKNEKRQYPVGSANFKLRLFLFFNLFKEELEVYKLNGMFWSIIKIYSIRNLNHRSGYISRYQEQILSDSGVNYFRFYNTLLQFMEKVKDMDANCFVSITK